MILIGYISLDEFGDPLRKPRSGYGFQSQKERGYHPSRIYTTAKLAEAQSPVGKSAAAYIRDDAS
jgi:hypothetical protein